MAEEKRKSFVEKKLEFLINVDNYETLRVGTTFGETIEWSTPEERQKKLDAITKSLASEVAKDAQEIMKSYGLKRKSTTQIDRKNRVNLNDLDDIEETDKEVESIVDNVEDDEDEDITL